MIACPNCGFEAPDDFAFCPRCATALTAPHVIAEERKVVTTLFCDLVAFTAMSEGADPEDVDALLGDYFARATKLIESHGGTVEKFIGDAVVGVFGVPAVHEDDPERAVRAGLRIVEALDGMTRPDGSPLEVRVGVNTGEALVRLDVEPASGRGFLTGDAVNTAARLQAAAPRGSVAVGALTHELTQRAIVYEDLPPVNAKGKAEPVRAWLAVQPVARTGLRTAGLTATPFLGREVELASLQGAFLEASRAGEGHIVLLVGEPGIGKSRLVLEFARSLDGHPEMITWRQGRCQPYGEGVAFSALGDIVKEHAGILDSDAGVTVAAKLDSVLPECEDRPWLRQRLRPLLGLEASQSGREENFAAWTRFLELIATGPTVLVLEDLHWAGEAMLAFVEHLLSRHLEVPVLVIATTRPELMHQHSGTLTSAADDHHLHRITLPALSQHETGELVADLLDAELATDLGMRIVDLVGGNPLYAEQYVRLLLDRGFLVRAADGRHLITDTELPVPETVQAVIAARLDTLPPEHKAFLCDAAVIGETFWGGGVAALSGRETSAVDETAAALVALGLVRPALNSTMEGEPEYLFWHALTRDVAYQQLPRRLRARKHEAAALWIEREAGDRRSEFAEILAHHYVKALELARATSQGENVEAWTCRAVEFLTLAGDHSLRLDVAAAERHYDHALELLPASSPERPSLLVKWGDSLYQLGGVQESAQTLEEAARIFKGGGDVRNAAAAMGLQSRSMVELGDPGGEALAVEALTLLVGDGPSPEMVTVLEMLARYQAVAADCVAAIETAEKALVTARELGAAVPLSALHYRGVARSNLGDAGGLDDMRRALVIAKRESRTHEATGILFNLGDVLWLTEGAGSAVEARRECVAFADAHGQEWLARRFSAGLASSYFWAGEWDRSLELSLATDLELERLGDELFLAYLRADRSLLHALRGEAAAAEKTARWADEQARACGEPDLVRRGALAAGVVADLLGDHDAARAALSEYATLVGRHPDADYALSLRLAVSVALRADDVRLARSLASHSRPFVPLDRLASAAVEALLAEKKNELETAAQGFSEAVARWRGFGLPYEEAQALLGQGRCLVGLGRAPEAQAPLAAARETLARLGAKPALAETDELMQQVASA